MKKYSILLLLAALSGCSLVPSEILSKEFIAEDIPGEAIPAALDNKTLVYGEILGGGSIDLRFTNGYVSVKGNISDPYGTYAARIVKIVSGSAGEHKLFISDGSRQKGKLRVNALYITNGGKNFYGIGLSNDINIDAPFPEVYNPASGSDSRGKLQLGWSVDEAHKPTITLPPSHQGTYKSIWGDHRYIVSASGISEGGSGYTGSEQKFLRIVVSGTDYECYTSRSAYKITANDLHIGGGSDYNPGTDVTFGSPPVATK